MNINPLQSPIYKPNTTSIQPLFISKIHFNQTQGGLPIYTVRVLGLP